MPSGGSFSGLSVLNVNSVLRQLPPAVVRAMGAPSLRLPDKWLHTCWSTWLQPQYILSSFACSGDSRGRELRIRRAISSAFNLGWDPHPNPLGEFPVEQSCPSLPSACQASSPLQWVQIPGRDQITVQSLLPTCPWKGPHVQG